MKFFLIPLFFLQITLSAEELEFDWKWIGNEYDLFFQIDLNEGLFFDPIYTVHSNEAFLVCELSIKPLPDFNPLEGYRLKNINLSVTVENTEQSQEVFYTVKAATSYLKLDQEGKRQAFVVDYLYEDFMLNSTVDVTEEPFFYSFIEKEDSGVIRFRNLFRCQD